MAGEAPLTVLCATLWVPRTQEELDERAISKRTLLKTNSLLIHSVSTYCTPTVCPDLC